MTLEHHINFIRYLSIKCLYFLLLIHFIILKKDSGGKHLQKEHEFMSAKNSKNNPFIFFMEFYYL